MKWDKMIHLMNLKKRQAQVRLRWQRDETAAIKSIRNDRVTTARGIAHEILVRENTFYSNLTETDRLRIEKHKARIHVMQQSLETAEKEVKDCDQKIIESENKEKQIQLEIIDLQKRVIKWEHLAKEAKNDQAIIMDRKEESLFDDLIMSQRRGT